MTRTEIKNTLTEMDFLESKETEALADFILNAMERKPGAQEKAAAVLDWLYAADRIELKHLLDLRDLIF
jgi:hypothetical protein